MNEQNTRLLAMALEQPKEPSVKAHDPDLGRRLRLLRGNLSVPAMAQIMNTQSGNLYRLEKGGYDIQLTTLQRLIRALGIENDTEKVAFLVMGDPSAS